jgi:predicted ArsR family transcriptional regulator
MRKKPPTQQEVLEAFDRLGHPLRARVLLMMIDSAGPLSPREAAEALGATLGTVSYHFRARHDGGLVRLVHTGQVRGAISHHYAATAEGRSAVEPLSRLVLGKAGK